MKRFFLFFALFSALFCGQAQNLSALLNYKTFATDKLNPYVEFDFLINGKSVHYLPAGDQFFAAEVEITVNVEQNDSVIKSLHFILSSEKFADSTRANKPDFSTIENLQLANGDYMLHFFLKDRNSTNPPVEYVDLLQVNFPDDKLSMSKTALFSTLTAAENDSPYNKYGYTMTPLYFDYAAENQPLLPFATEIYNTEKIFGKNGTFLVKSYIELHETGALGNAQNIFYAKKHAAPVVVFLHQFNIFKLYSGNYNLVVEILDNDSNVVLSQKTFFQRSNPAVALQLSDYEDVTIANSFVSNITDPKVLQEYVASLYPIATVVEQDFFDKRMKKIPFDKLQRYFYSFWLSRNANDPEGAWKNYKQQVDWVNKTYGSKIVKGYRTDRGRVYLKYGKPQVIDEVPYDPQAFPYEIWTYYTLGTQTNVKFVFYSRDFVTNEYVLLHSNAIGEVSNPQWQIELSKRLNPTINPDDTRAPDYWGGEINDNWRLNR